MLQGMLEQSNIAESIINFLIFQNAELWKKTSSFDHVYNLLTSTHTRSSFKNIIPYLLTYSKVVSSLEHFDKEYEWISHFPEAPYMPRNIRPCWLGHGVDTF